MTSPLSSIGRHAVLFLALCNPIACGGARSSGAASDELLDPGADAAPGSNVGANDGGSQAGDSSSSPGSGGDASACAGGSVTFSLQLTGFSSQAVTCLGTASSCSWLSITGPGSAPLLLDAPCGVVCAPGECFVADCACTSSPATSANPTRTWDGTIYTEGREAASCSDPGPFICYNPGCATPGQYVATMCAAPLQSGDATPSDVLACEDFAGTPQCVQVPFQWPPAAPGTVVTGTIDVAVSGDGG